ncbi:MAG: hypothetical protein ACLTYN_14780 [Dysosmobacter welbionis]
MPWAAAAARIATPQTWRRAPDPGKGHTHRSVDRQSGGGEVCLRSTLAQSQADTVSSHPGFAPQGGLQAIHGELYAGAANAAIDRIPAVLPHTVGVD